MSSGEHYNNSESSKQSRKYQIRKNNQGQNEVVIPCWQNDGDSSSLAHIREENRLLKNKNKHLQGHLEETLNQYNQLHQLFLQSQVHEKELLVKVNQLGAKNKQLKTQLANKEMEYEDMKNDLDCFIKREEEYHKKISKLKLTENELQIKINELESLNESLNAKLNLKDLKSSKNSFSETDIAEYNKLIQELRGQLQKKQNTIKDNQLQLYNIRAQLNLLKQKNRKFSSINQNSEQLRQKVQSLEKYIKQLQKSANKPESQQHLNCENSIRNLQKQLKQNKNQLSYLQQALNQKNREINELKVKRSSQYLGNESSEELQKQYNNELQSLRRLILYKRYSNQTVQDRMAEQKTFIKKQYQDRINQLVAEYRLIQRELQTLKIQLISRQRRTDQTKIVAELEKQNIYKTQVHQLLLKIQLLENQRVSFIGSIQKWKIAYEDLRTLYEEKLISKDQHIHLLKLRLGDYSH